jgi:hypothetical protein
MAGNFPIYYVIFEGASLRDIGHLRFQFNRGATPYWFSLLSNYTLSVFGPLVFLYFLRKRFFLRAFLIFVWIAIYSIASGARGSIVIFIFTIIIVGLFTDQLKIYKLSSLIIIFLFVFTVISGFTLGHNAVRDSNKCPLPYGANFSPSNILRSCETNDAITLNPLSDSLGYRLFLTPVEVSNNWYEYYSKDSNKKRTINDVLSRENSRKASNIIAQEYYAKFWPNHYSVETNANTSIDADAFSIGGFFLIILCSILLIFIRILPYLIVIKNSLSTKYLEGFIVMFFTLFPAGGSIQSIFVAQGFLVVCFFYLINYFIALNRSKR